MTGSSLDSLSVGLGGLSLIILLLQLPAVALLFSRLLRGPSRRSPIEPMPSLQANIGAVSVVLPTLNEAECVAPCLSSLSQQSYDVREILVVDSNSEDGTVDKVKAAQRNDPRFRVLCDDPLPSDWVGRPWALHTGFLNSSEQSEWLLGIDADTQLHPGLVAGLLDVAQREHYDLISLSPKFILRFPGEWLLQPALLMTLVYRFGPSGGASDGSERVMANGQCFLIRRSLLSQLGGYCIARQSFADDVTLARYAADQGARVAFLDGAHVLKVRMYDGIQDTWDGWGRSLDLKDACSTAQRWGDVAFLIAVQALPILLLPLLGLLWWFHSSSLFLTLLLGLNSALVLIRFALLLAIAPSYDFSQAAGSAWSFWLSPLADPAAVYRIFLSSTRRPTQWRSRQYDHFDV
ncbi:MAG: 2'-O-glycosyltransferase CruG [Cyanobacteria bacterium J06626_14]